MFKVGTVKGYRKEDKPFAEVQIDMETEKLDWFPIMDFSGIEAQPQIDDQVVLLLDRNDKGIVLHGFAPDDFTKEDFEKRTQQRSDKEVIHRYVNKDKETIFDIKPQEIEFEKKNIFKEANEYENIPTGTATIDGVSRTTYGFYVNGALRYFPDMS